MANPIRRGDLVKSRLPGGHVMTVQSVDAPNRKVIAAYQLPDGRRVNETWDAADLKRVSI